MAGLADRFYLASPIWAQQCAVASYGWWWYRRRFSPHFHRLVAQLKAREQWTIEQFRNYQEEQLNKILEAAWNSPYYRQIFTDAGVNPAMKASDSLRRLPPLSKETLRTSARDLLSQSSLPKGTISFKSSGTTGTPTEIFYTPEFHALEVAVLEARALNWAGVHYRDRRVMFGVRKVCRFDQRKPPFWRFSPAEKLAYASIYHLSPEFLRYYLEFLRSYRPAIVMGYPSALNTIACYALSNNDTPFPAKAVVTTSETVTAETRKKIETAFQCRIYDSYGAVEMCVFASQCEYGSYHLSPEISLVEIVDRTGHPVPPGVMGEVICTGLQNMLHPLIRYRVGDIARWAIDQDCRCGRQMPILENIEGRFEDICYTPDGRETLRFDTVFKGIENVREAQVVQEKIDLFTVNVVPTNGFDERDIETIKHNMQLHVGNVHTEVKTVDAIARTASGKFRAVICNLPLEEKH
jgi:phenylacetate-coenzyme A ligase PaaK-like adenylate-forming protein